MTGLAYHSLTGEIISEKLPTNEELAQIILA